MTHDLREYQAEDEAPDGAPSGQAGITLEEAREAYVQKNYAGFERSFKAFDEAGGFRFTFSVVVFFAGVLWFLYRKMYVEALFIFTFSLIAGGVAGALVPPGESDWLLRSFSICMSAVLAFSARWFYWKAVDRKVEQAWDRSGGNPREALVWLRQKGGVNLGLVLAILAGILLFFISFTPMS